MDFLRKIFGLKKEQEPAVIKRFEKTEGTGRVAGIVWEGGGAALVMENQIGTRMRYDINMTEGKTSFCMETPDEVVEEITGLMTWPNGQKRPTVDTHRRAKIRG